MKTHKGMRPQDIVVLLQILLKNGEQWQYRDLAHELRLSVSEISGSLVRSFQAGLVDESRRKVFRKSLLEFLQYGLHYVFPEQPGTMVTGAPTAHSHPAFQRTFSGSEPAYVWPYSAGNVRGLAIKPLYKRVPEAALDHPELYPLLACIDVLRVGKAREKNMAKEILNKKIGYPEKKKNEY